MFEKKEGNDSNIGISTQCIQNVCRRKVISSASDLCAIMFYRLVSFAMTVRVDLSDFQLQWSIFLSEAMKPTSTNE